MGGSVRGGRGKTILADRADFQGFLLAAADPASWAQFLGPRRDGISPETGLNTDWNAQKPKLLWSAPLGNGFSSVSLVGDRL